MLSQHRKQNKWLKNVLWTVPVVAIHLCIPTLNKTGVKSQPWNIPLTSEDLILNVAYSDMNFHEERYWTFASYMFLHANENHLIGNLASFISLSIPLFDRIGPFATHLVFFLGGVCSVIPTAFTRLQSESRNWNRLLATFGISTIKIPFWFENVLRDFKSSQLGEHFLRTLDRVSSSQLGKWLSITSSQMSSKLASKLSVFIPHIGSSGGIFALLGCQLAMYTEDIISYIFDDTKQRSVFDFFENIASKLLVVCASVYSVSNEISLLRQGVYLQTDNAGHIQGFVSGIAIYILIRACAKIFFVKESINR